MDLAPDDKPQKTTWMKFKGHPPPPKKPCIMHNERPIEQNQAATNKARGGQNKLIPRKEGSLQKVAQTRSKGCNHEEEDIWKPWRPSQATSRDRIYLLEPKLGIIASVRGRTLAIGRGECFRETAKTTEDGSSYGKDGSGHGKVGHTDFTFYNSCTHFVKRHTFYNSRTHFVKRPN